MLWSAEHADKYKVRIARIAAGEAELSGTVAWLMGLGMPQGDAEVDVLRQLADVKDYIESQHPRDSQGQWAHKPGGPRISKAIDRFLNTEPKRGIIDSRSPAQMTLAEFAADPRTQWHGSKWGTVGGGGDTPLIHVGTWKTAHEALAANVAGQHAEGDVPTTVHHEPPATIWRDRRTGQTVTFFHGKPEPGYEANYEQVPNPDREPFDTHPVMVPVRVVGPMAEGTYHDFVGMEEHVGPSAEGILRGQLRRGQRPRQGYWYTNEGEGVQLTPNGTSYTRSAVVPDASWLKTHEDYVAEALRSGQLVPDEVLADYPNLKPAKAFDPHQLRDHYGRWTDEHNIAPLLDELTRYGPAPGEQSASGIKPSSIHPAQLEHTAGHWGRGFVKPDGGVYTWNEEDGTHDLKQQELFPDTEQGWTDAINSVAFYVGVDGHVTTVNHRDDDLAPFIESQALGIKTATFQDPRTGFTSTAKRGGRGWMVNPVGGPTWGKGLLEPDGTLTTWKTNDEGFPYHEEVRKKLDINGGTEIVIHPSGWFWDHRRDPALDGTLRNLGGGLKWARTPEEWEKQTERWNRNNAKAFDPNERRDDHGRWTRSGLLAPGVIDPTDVIDPHGSALAAQVAQEIASIHGYPANTATTRVIPNDPDIEPGINGDYKSDLETMSLGPLADASIVTHELGHKLDHTLGYNWGVGLMASDVSYATPFADGSPEAAMQGVFDAIKKSSGYGRVRHGPMSRGTRYWYSPHELFARAYAQYMAQRLGKTDFSYGEDNNLLDDIKLGVQWADDDFQPIAAAIDNLLNVTHLAVASGKAFDIHEPRDEHGRWTRRTGLARATESITEQVKRIMRGGKLDGRHFVVKQDREGFPGPFTLGTVDRTPSGHWSSTPNQEWKGIEDHPTREDAMQRLVHMHVMYDNPALPYDPATHRNEREAQVIRKRTIDALTRGATVDDDGTVHISEDRKGHKGRFRIGRVDRDEQGQWRILDNTGGLPGDNTGRRSTFKSRADAVRELVTAHVDGEADARRVKAFDPRERRDHLGRWTDGSLSNEVPVDLPNLHDRVDRAIAAVSAVHGYPPGTPHDRITVADDLAGGVQADYRPDAGSIELKYGAMSQAIFHEFGHKLDWALGQKVGDYASLHASTADFGDDPQLQAELDVQSAIQDTKAYKRLYTWLGAVDEQPAHYWQEPSELFARAYARYMGQRAPQMDYYVDPDAIDVGTEWDDEDFKPVAAAIDRLLNVSGLHGKADYVEDEHPRDWRGRWRDRVTRIGVTPFRPQDTVEGFRDTPKYKRFLKLIDSASEHYGVQVGDRVENEGIWKEGGEPSVDLGVKGDGVLIEGFGATLGKAYDQDAVAFFSEDESGSDVRWRLSGIKDWDKARELAAEHLGFANLSPDKDRLEYWDAGGTSFDKVGRLAKELGAQAEFTFGRFTLIERDGYDEAIRRAEERLGETGRKSDARPGGPGSADTRRSRGPPPAVGQEADQEGLGLSDATLAGKFDPHQRRDDHGRWSDGGSVAHLTRNFITPADLPEWEKGDWGKGIAGYGGDVTVWRVHPPELGPHHDDVAEALGSDDEGFANGYTFTIHPSGMVVSPDLRYDYLAMQFADATPQSLVDDGYVAPDEVEPDDKRPPGRIMQDVIADRLRHAIPYGTRLVVDENDWAKETSRWETQHPEEMQFAARPLDLSPEAVDAGLHAGRPTIIGGQWGKVFTPAETDTEPIATMVAVAGLRSNLHGAEGVVVASKGDKLTLLIDEREVEVPAVAVKRFDPNQRRDDHGRWTRIPGVNLIAPPVSRSDETLNGQVARILDGARIENDRLIVAHDAEGNAGRFDLGTVRKLDTGKWSAKPNRGAQSEHRTRYDAMRTLATAHARDLNPGIEASPRELTAAEAVRQAEELVRSAPKLRTHKFKRPAGMTEDEQVAWDRGEADGTLDHLMRAPDPGILVQKYRMDDLGVPMQMPTEKSRWTGDDFRQFVDGVQHGLELFPWLTKDGNAQIVDTIPTSGASLKAQGYARIMHGATAATDYHGRDRKSHLIINDIEPHDDVVPDDGGIIAPSSRSLTGAAVHEMGHAFAAATGLWTDVPGQDKMTDDYDTAKRLHHEWGLGYGDLAPISVYATAGANEAFAELFSMYFAPGNFRDQLDPDVRERAGRMIAALAQRGKDAVAAREQS